MNTSVDLDLLKRIVALDYRIPDEVDAVSLLPGLMENLGSTNSDLRENSLDVLWSWLVENHYDDSVMRAIAKQMAHNLTIGLGEACSDTIFLRAFSALILKALIDLDQDRRSKNLNGLFSNSEVLDFLDLSIQVITKEKDLRGYTEKNGWAHCSAHMGDLLSGFAGHSALNQTNLQDILNALQERFLSPVIQPFVHNEDERLAAVVIHVLQRDLVPMNFYSIWLEKFLAPSNESTWKDAFTHPTQNCARVNVKNFLRALYFFLVFGYQDDSITLSKPSVNFMKQALLSALKNIYPNNRYGDESF